MGMHVISKRFILLIRNAKITIVSVHPVACLWWLKHDPVLNRETF